MELPCYAQGPPDFQSGASTKLAWTPFVDAVGFEPTFFAVLLKTNPATPQRSRYMHPYWGQSEIRTHDVYYRFCGSAVSTTRASAQIKT